jgi:ABC-2 type transport system permease protein
VNSFRVFAVGGLISYRALFGFLAPAVFIPTLLVVPVFQILLFVYIGRSAGVESDRFYVIGNSIHNASLPCLWAMTHAIAGERFQQTLGYILISPARRAPLFLGRAVPVIANGFFVSAFAFVVGGLLVGVTIPAGSVAPIALVVLVGAISCTGLGLVNAGIGLVVREVAVLSNILFGGLMVLTGANVPIDELPGWLQPVSHGLPLTHAIAAARELADGAALSGVADLIAAEMLVGALYGAAGFALIRLLETQSRRHATLERA